MESLKSSAIKYAVRGLYFAISSRSRGDELTVLNYGFDDGNKIPLDPPDLPNASRLALYHHLANAVDLSNKDVLEVGSGRGGGASYLARHFHPRSVHGVDLSGKAIRFCQRNFNVSGLTFSQGDAEELDLEDNSFDVLVNIESSHNYPNMGRFVSEAYRVLKPNGYFLLADMRPADKIAPLKGLLNQTGFKIIKEEDISANVLSALDQGSSSKDQFIQQRIPKILRGPVSIFAGVSGTRFHRMLQDGRLRYFNIASLKE